MDIRLAVTQTYFIQLLIWIFKFACFNSFNWAFNLQFYALWKGREEIMKQVIRESPDKKRTTFRMMIRTHQVGLKDLNNFEYAGSDIFRPQYAWDVGWVAYLANLRMWWKEARLSLLARLVGHHHSRGVTRAGWGRERSVLHQSLCFVGGWNGLLPLFTLWWCPGGHKK